MTSDPWDAIDREFPVAPLSVDYRIPAVTIDAAVELAIGSEVGLRVFAVVAPADSAATDSCGDRVPTAALRIVDWEGPWLEPHNPTEPPVIAEHILDAAARGIEAAAKRSDPAATDPELSRALARAAIESVARRVSPTNDEATAMLVGVLRLDVEKLTKTGDRMAAMLASHEELVALWRGLAHNDWAKHHALQRAAMLATTDPVAVEEVEYPDA